MHYYSSQYVVNFEIKCQSVFNLINVQTFVFFSEFLESAQRFIVLMPTHHPKGYYIMLFLTKSLSKNQKEIDAMHSGRSPNLVGDFNIMDILICVICFKYVHIPRTGYLLVHTKRWN